MYVFSILFPFSTFLVTLLHITRVHRYEVRICIPYMCTGTEYIDFLFFIIHLIGRYSSFFGLFTILNWPGKFAFGAARFGAGRVILCPCAFIPTLPLMRLESSRSLRVIRYSKIQNNGWNRDVDETTTSAGETTLKMVQSWVTKLWKYVFEKISILWESRYEYEGYDNSQSRYIEKLTNSTNKPVLFKSFITRRLFNFGGSGNFSDIFAAILSSLMYISV